MEWNGLGAGKRERAREGKGSQQQKHIPFPFSAKFEMRHSGRKEKKEAKGRMQICVAQKHKNTKKPNDSIRAGYEQKEEKRERTAPQGLVSRSSGPREKSRTSQSQLVDFQYENRK